MADHKTPHQKPVTVHADEKPKGGLGGFMAQAQVDPRLVAATAAAPTKKGSGKPAKEPVDSRAASAAYKEKCEKAQAERVPILRTDTPFVPYKPRQHQGGPEIETHPHHSSFSAADSDCELPKGAKKPDAGTAPVFVHPYGSEPRRIDYVEPPKVKAAK
jgi:hypothetical protein